MTLPPQFPFVVKVRYGGLEYPELDESHREIIKTYDPDFDQREECKKGMERQVLHRLSLFLHKYPILKRVLCEARPPMNITLRTIIEDALKQNITELSETMTSFMDFLDECKGKYSTLFRKHAQDKFIAAMANPGQLEMQEALQKWSEEINLKREKLMGFFNHKGNPSAESFDDLKKRVDQLRQLSKNYRDTNSAHWDENEITVCWNELDTTIKQFRELVCDFYSIFTFEQGYGDALGQGFSEGETVKVLIQEMYR